MKLNVLVTTVLIACTITSPCHGMQPEQASQALANFKNFIDKRDNETMWEGGNTALYLSAKKGSSIISTTLLEAQASPDISTKDGTYPLHEAVEHNDVNLVQCLLQYKASQWKKNKEGKLPIHLAVEILSNDSFGNSIERAHTKEIINALHSADNSIINKPFQSKNGTNKTPLSIAIEDYNYKAIETLLELKAQTDKIVDSDENKTPLEIAIALNPPSEDKIISIIDLFQKHAPESFNYANPEALPQQSTPLHSAAQNLWKDANKANQAFKLLATEKNINAKTKTGKTALHYAIENPNITVSNIECLLELGADPTIQNNNTKTPLNFAQEQDPQKQDIINSLTNAETKWQKKYSISPQK